MLDLCCAAGGWSVPFLEYGDEVVGIDIKKTYKPYPGQLILQDIRTVDGSRFKDFDLIIGSPPCVEFSNARYKSRHVHGKNPNPEKGMELINEFWRISLHSNLFYTRLYIDSSSCYYYQYFNKEDRFSERKTRIQYFCKNIIKVTLTQYFIPFFPENESHLKV